MIQHNAKQQDTCLSSWEEFLKFYKVGADEGWLALYLEAANENIKKIKHENPEKLSSFLWMFRALEADFRETKKTMTEALCDKIDLLRNFFVHPSHKTPLSQILECSHDLYCFLEGKLRSMASQETLMRGADSEVLAERTLIRRVFLGKDKGFFYELTYHGMIFLCTLALYRDEAENFLSGLKHMKKGDLYSRDLKEFFTYFSIRKNYQISGSADFDSLHFAALITYLNKVPQISMDYLSLKQERRKLQEMEKNSTESEENKEYKYRLQPRMREKFTSFALAYLEDFNLFPEFRFKRLNVGDSERTSEYLYGREEKGQEHSDENDTRMNRHFALNKDNAGFAWSAGPEHYGNIRIREIHGSLSRDALKKLVALSLNAPEIYNKVRENMLDYLSVYHRMLEKILDFANEGSFFRLDDVLPELAVLTGCTNDELKMDFVKLATPMLGSALVRILQQSDKGKDVDPETALLHRLDLAIEQTFQFEKRIKKEKIRDNVKISEVMAFFFLHSPRFPFRQLPFSKQHRACLDYEYQTIHELIGNYGKYPKKLWKHFEKYKDKENDKNFPASTKLSIKEATALIQERLGLLEASRSLKNTMSLDELALAAARERRRMYLNARDILRSKDDPEYKQTLDIWQKRLGSSAVREISRESVFATILKLNEKTWSGAFDYEQNRRHQRQITDTEHIISQFVFPANVIEHLLRRENVFSLASRNPSLYDREKGQFDFNRYFREMKTNLMLRDFYDSSVLVQWLRDNAGEKSFMPVNTLKRNEVNSAMKKIKEFHAQDKLLLKIAFLYFERSHRKLAFTKEIKNEKSIYEIYTAPIQNSVCGITYEVLLADRNKAIYGAVEHNLSKFADVLRKCVSQTEQKIFSFRELMEGYEAMRHSDNRIRKTFIMPILRLEAREGGTPDGVNAAEHLHNMFPVLSVEEADRLIRFRNQIMHMTNVNLNVPFDPENAIKPLLEKCGCWEKEPEKKTGSAKVKTFPRSDRQNKKQKIAVGEEYHGEVIKKYDWGILIRMGCGKTGAANRNFKGYDVGDNVKVRIVKIKPDNKIDLEIIS